MTLAAQIVTSGVVTGLIYMLIALGVTLLFGIMRVVNFVHGELVMRRSTFFLGAAWRGVWGCGGLCWGLSPPLPLSR